MEEALRAILRGDTALVALVGTRIDWGLRVQAAGLPAVSLTVVSTVPVYSDEGEAGLTESRVQVDCWGANYKAAKDAARAIRARLSGIDEVTEGVVISSATLEDEQDSAEEASGAVTVHRTRMDWTIWHDA